MNAVRGAIVVIIALVIGVIVLARGLDDPETTNEPVETTDTTAPATTPPPADPSTTPPPTEPTPPPTDPTPPPTDPTPPPPPAEEAKLPPAAAEDMFDDPLEPSPTHNRSDVRVLVANGSSVCGAAGRLATSLSAQGFNVLAPVNDDIEGDIDASAVYYVEEYGADAGVVASLLQVDSSQVLAMPSSPPTAPSDAHVMIHIGADDLAQPNC